MGSDTYPPTVLQTRVLSELRSFIPLNREREIIDKRFDKLMQLLRRKRMKDTQFEFAEGMLREKLPEALEWGIQFFFLVRNGSDGGGKAQ